MDDTRDRKRNEETSTAVTRISSVGKPNEHAVMTFSAVISHQAMAEAFINELIRIAQRLIPDHSITPEELLAILQRSLDEQGSRSITLVSGRHLRARISEQVSRAKRYEEYFSLLVLHLDEVEQIDDYDAIVDTLRERMRQTDLIFLFKHRIVLLLPHTESDSCRVLLERIQMLVTECMVNAPNIPIERMTFPNDDMNHSMQVLDWTENQLRG
jgi:GGDEF domain-containing protein